MNKWIGSGCFYVNKFDGPSTVILWIELILFAMLYGVAFRSWLLFGFIFLGLSVLMHVPKRTVYIIIALSCLWGFIAFSIGHSISWGWAIALGMGFFLLGGVMHATSLKKLVPTTVVAVINKNIKWHRNGYEGLQNLN